MKAVLVSVVVMFVFGAGYVTAIVKLLGYDLTAYALTLMAVLGGGWVILAIVTRKEA